ncbi:MAG: hypothetical protein NVS3B26_14490 [Mycobacteriales bacterium]
MRPAHGARRRTPRDWAATAFVAAMLTVDAGVHAQLARRAWNGWQLLTPAQLFGVEALAAAVVGLAVLASNRRLVWGGAALVALGGLAAVVLTRYVDVPAIGPIPSIYEPIWYGQKTWSAIAEGLGGIVAAAQLVELHRRDAADDRRRNRGRVIRAAEHLTMTAGRPR